MTGNKYSRSQEQNSAFEELREKIIIK